MQAAPALAASLISAFAQALSAAAQDDEAMAGFYRDRRLCDPVDRHRG